MIEVGELDYYEYRVLLRDAVIYRLNQSEHGQEYLQNAWCFSQTKPDRKRLRAKMRQKGE